MAILSERVSNIRPSPTLEILAKAKQMKNKGLNVLDFSVGEPDFDTPENIKKAFTKALKEGYTKYTETAGIMELRQAIAEKLKKENKINAETEEILVSHGAKHVLDNIFRTLCNKNDEVIIPAPYWPSFAEQVKLAEATPIIIESAELKFSAQELKEKISNKTKILVLNSPNNPSGMVYSKNELKKIAEIAIEHKLLVVSDEIYEKLVFDQNNHTSIASLSNEIKNQTITVNGFSKTYAMTGLRLGYCHANRQIIQAMQKLQSNASGNANSATQKAAIEALTGTQEPVKKMIQEFSKRKKLIEKGLNKINGFICPSIQGAFYAFPDITNCLKKQIPDSASFCSYMLEKLNIATVPGKEFGKENQARFSFATSSTTIIEGLKRLEKEFN